MSSSLLSRVTALVSRPISTPASAIASTGPVTAQDSCSTPSAESLPGILVSVVWPIPAS